METEAGPFVAVGPHLEEIGAHGRGRAEKQRSQGLVAASEPCG